MIDTVIANHKKIDIFCIGTPKAVGDAIGPLVGSMLQHHDLGSDVRVIGTFSTPVTYPSYYDKVWSLRDDALVIVVDSTVGKRVGEFDIVMEPTRPGGALGTGIEPVGDISVKAYTGDSLASMLQADFCMVAVMAHAITTKLIDLLSSNKKGRYIDMII